MLRAILAALSFYDRIMSGRRWSGTDEIPGIGKIAWTVRIVDRGGKLVKVFDGAKLAGGELTDDQLNEVKALLLL
jgi:hypothetical protein